MTLLVAAVALCLLGGLWWRYGWRGLAAGALALAAGLAALLGQRRPGKGPPSPPPPPPGDKVKRTAGDIIRERAEAERAAIEKAKDDPGELARIMRGQR